MTDTWLVVGLGNPGPEYAGTRHNIGFMAVDALAERWKASAFSKKFQGEIADVTVQSQRALLLKPLTFMNRSGGSVQAASAFYKIPPERILVMHDELDLPVGKLRIKQGGGANGHNGLKDIDRVIGPDYWRLRLGIGHPGDKAQVHGHVLNDFSKEEKVQVARQLEVLSEHFALFFTASPSKLANKIAQVLHPPLPKASKTPSLKSSEDGNTASLSSPKEKNHGI